MVRKVLASAAFVVALASCNKPQERPAPPRVTTAPEFPVHASTFTVPIELSLDTLQQSLESRTPRKLWSIDERRPNCIPAQRIKALGQRIKVTPDIACRIVGQVTRGRISLTGKGRQLTIVMPVSAVVSARDVGGVIKRETATGSATVRADVRLGMSRDWRPNAKVDISYGWREPPGIDILGQRIRFAQRADRELAGVIAGLERELQAEVSRQRVRPIVADAWRQGFAVIELNGKDPPAWMRVTPTGLAVAGYKVEGRKVKLTVAAAATAETFVGDERPEPAKVTPLPPQMARIPPGGVKVAVPVLADYAQLEPVVLRALKKLAAKGIAIEGLGRVETDFRKVTIYATENGRLAVGIDARVEPIGERFGTSLGRANGEVWLTGLPVNEPDSQVIRIEQLDVYGGADKMPTDLLIRLLLTEDVKAQIASGLTEDFGRDFARILAAARKAVALRREGDFAISATIREVHHDRIQATGKGLYLPVVASGVGEIAYRPRR